MAGPFSRSAHGDSPYLPKKCASCHLGHGAPRTSMLPDAKNRTCLTCHGDTSARNKAKQKGLTTGTANLLNIAAEFRKPSHHPLAEGKASSTKSSKTKTLADRSSVATEVSCTDCHDAHYAIKGPGKSIGKGVSKRAKPKEMHDARGARQPEHTLCYKCHGSASAAEISRKDIQRLLRPSNPSFHPVEAIGRNESVPSLIKPNDAQSYVACSDCHASDQADGTAGPHGSMFRPILKANYQKEDKHDESSYEYALCYKCHNRSVLLADTSFSEHRKHIVDEKTSCFACHDSHGSTQYKHLINFDAKIVYANQNGQLSFTDLGSKSGSCNLLCHSKNHDDEQY